MKKIKIFTMLAVLLITSLGLFSVENAQASSSGWVTQNGIQAKVSTNKDTYGSEQIVVTGEKTGTGKLYYMVEIAKLTVGPASPWEQVGDSQYGSFTGKTPELKFSHAGKGTYKIQLRIFKDAATNEYVGSWTTNVSVK
ncbi:hypothetical protein [Lysinibacillus xylanilyticus]|uniref:hypothetical protein n=1 Tax=Lysinibacillus xylanilyticus TaxID=582475 RepID=UPI00380A5A48